MEKEEFDKLPKEQQEQIKQEALIAVTKIGNTKHVDSGIHPAKVFSALILSFFLTWFVTRFLLTSFWLPTDLSTNGVDRYFSIYNIAFKFVLVCAVAFPFVGFLTYLLIGFLAKLIITKETK